MTTTITDRGRPTSRNELLARLPTEDYRRLVRFLDVVPMSTHQILQKAHEPVERIYFPSGGVCSITKVMTDGQMAGTSAVGKEGFIGIGALFEGELENGEATVEIADGDIHVMGVPVFRHEIERRGPFYDVVCRYANAFVAGLTQSVACNALHPVEKRCARLLLESHDRMERDDFPLSQEALAKMLGVRRASVTLAAGSLHRARLIDYEYTHIVIRNRAGLEAVSCECYAAVKEYFASLFP
jgi:CRP-like cAMP-binding protein